MFASIYAALFLFFAKTEEIDTLLFGPVKDDCKGTVLFKVVAIIANFILGGVIIGATIGIILSGVQILTARDDPGQVAKGKQRIINVVIGIVAASLMYVILNFIVPGGITLDSAVFKYDENGCPDVPQLSSPPGGGTQPGEPGEDPPAGQGGCKGNTVENGGYCYAKTTVMAYDYVKNACKKYHTCQSYKSDAWGSKCAQVATMNVGEMMNGFKKVHESIESTGAHYSGYNVAAPANEDNVSKLLCNGSLSRATTKPGASSINRIAFKRALETIVTELEAGHPITIAAGVKHRGKWTEARNRHFITIVAVSKEMNSGNVKDAVVEFESGNCISSGKAGKPEPWDQPYITVNGKKITFKYVDPWGATMNTLGEAGGRLWRLHYDSTGWYFYKYR